MNQNDYSIDTARDLWRRATDPALEIRRRPSHYEAGEELDYAVTTVWPEVAGRARFRVEKFVGGGFAGQVYRCRVLALDFPSLPEGLREGQVCAVKVMLPPSRFSQGFRDALYWLAFQGSFSAQVSGAACRAGLLWQKAARLAAATELGDPEAVADVYGSFYDATLGSWGEVREWVEGRVWHLEPDTRLWFRRRWRTLDLAQTGSPEYVAKRRFMARFVRLLHDMGARELARQYEWWTMKSQPNTLKRAGVAGPDRGLCAVDFRTGLALLPWLPMSPADIPLILRGLLRGRLVQFDLCDFAKLRAFAAGQGRGPELGALVAPLERYDREYRRSLPDVTRHGLRLLVDSGLRADVRRGLIEGYRVNGLVDGAAASRLAGCVGRFAAFHLLGAVPALGAFVRRLWGRADYRRHVVRLGSEWAYFQRSARANMAACQLGWMRSGRVGDRRALYLAVHPVAYWAQRLTLGLLPAVAHRTLAEPSYAVARVRAWWSFVRSFYRDADFREQWFRDLVDEGHRDGVLDDRERDLILAKVRDPFIAKYLKCLGVHLATLPVSEIFWTIVGGIVGLWAYLAGRDWKLAVGALAGFVILMPVSPGSLIRGVYVVYLMVRERNFRDYMIAAPFSFLKIFGYFAFPMQMAASYPVLARFMASHWATVMVHGVPVFGEQGALLEHMVFDATFNAPRAFGQWAQRRMRLLLDAWLVFGAAVLMFAFARLDFPVHSKAGFNTLLGVICLCFLPRLLFYPMLKGKGATERGQRSGTSNLER